jgi:hypothetical protein
MQGNFIEKPTNVDYEISSPAYNQSYRKRLSGFWALPLAKVLL